MHAIKVDIYCNRALICYRDSMEKHIEFPLTNGMKTKIDSFTADTLKALGIKKLYVTKSDNGFYAMGMFKLKKQIALHRYIMGNPIGMQIDHIDGDTLNNTKENLRVCHKTQNLRNKKVKSPYGYRGVSRHPINPFFWSSSICFAQAQMSLGSFSTREDAAKAYDIAAVLLFGSFANPNFKRSRRYSFLRNKLIKEIKTLGLIE